MTIAIVGGTAGLGYGLALRMVSAGEDVVIGSRTEEKAAAAAEEAKKVLPAGTSVGSGANPDVVKGADIVVVTVPFPGQAGIYKSIKDNLVAGAVVLDCNVPLASEVGGKPTRLLGVWEGSAAQQAKGILGKDFPVASGFHTVMSAKLEDINASLDADVLVCGDKQARDKIKELVGKIKGARFVDCGPLENARLIESLTALLIGINMRFKLEPGAGIRIQGLPD